MKTLYIGSTVPFSGKGLITLGLGKHFIEKGLKIGYLKPLGKLPQKVKGDIVTDKLSYFIYQFFGLDDDLSNLCPVILTYELMVKVLRGEIKTLMPKVKEAFEVIAQGKDIVLVGGAETVWLGSFLGVSGFKVIEELDTKVVLVNKYTGEFFLDSVTEAKETLGERLVGIIINWVKEEQQRDIEELVVPWLENNGVPVLGIIPYDAFLTAVTVAELSERLGGRIISGQESLNNFIQNYLIGGMEVDKFAEYLRRTPMAAVIVGGDRADIQLLSIEEGAGCLVLTGNLMPNDIIISKAEQRGVPIILLREDSYSVAQKIQDIAARLSLKEKEKVERGLALVKKHVNFERLEKLL
ncbi:MAG: AAA family ATPase [Candidatus Desulfofervidaceae bacterium]|nr:AAA family ATPase [Candidatus Desulfofervidaceae bacterium]